MITLDEVETYADAENLRYAWHRWEMHSCEERGGHWWTLTGDHPDDWGTPNEGRVSLDCSYCSASTDDLAGQDSYYFVYGQIGDITIKGGYHDYHEDFEVLVSAEVEVKKYGPNLDMIYPEYDIYIIVESREP